MKGTYIFLADGFEISEALTTVNMLRRGGVNVKTVSIYDDRIVTSSNRIPVIADMAFGEFRASTSFGPCLKTDVMIFPGGMPGSENLRNHPGVCQAVKAQAARGGYIAAICAAPSILGKKQLLSEKKATCYPGFEDFCYGADMTGEKVTVDSKIITGRGPGAASEFGFTLASILKDTQTANNLKEAMQYND